MKLRLPLFLVSVLSALAALAFFYFWRGEEYRRPDWLYTPVVELGPPREPVVTFVWSAVSSESISEFQDHLYPLILSKRLSFRVNLLQILDYRFNDLNGPGALLLCAATKEDYINNALSYLSRANPQNVSVTSNAKGSSSLPWHVNDAIKLFMRVKAIDIRSCDSNPQFYVKQMRFAADTRIVTRRFQIKEVPSYIVDGRAVKPSDPRVAALLKESVE